MRIRELREKKGLTLEELAEKAGISRTLLSHIEEGRITPSIATLIHLSRVLGVPLRELTGQQEMEKISVVRSHERKDVERRPKTGPSKSGYHYQALAAKEGINAFLITFEEKSEDERVFFQHEGREFLYLLEGELELCVGDDCVILKPGDSASYESRYPHSLRGVGGPAKAIVVVYGEED
ncbi:MAG: helix-turn-helix domain-containing protein [Deferribacteres bacterium]|nr:helix-turn-helix domain-containing protein [Deferribacteres bacterium]